MASARAERRVHRRARRDELVAARRKWPVLVTFGGLATIVSVGLVVVFDSRVVSYLSGLYLGLFLAGLWTIVLDHTGVSLRRMAAQAEAWTAAVLRKAARHGWHSCSGVAVEGARVEQVAVNDRCVLAIQTRWAVDWSEGFGWQQRIRALRDAGWAAAKVTALLHDAGIDIAVRPVLVLWGPGAPPSGDEAGVSVVRGPELADRLAEMATIDGWAIEVDRALRVLESHLAGEDRSTAA